MDVTFFKDNLYFHLNQISGSKTFTLNKDEFNSLFNKKDDIIENVKKLAKIDKKQKTGDKKGKKKTKKVKFEEGDRGLSALEPFLTQ